ncbi:VOC family protein [Kitasatospora sp. NPDC048540]|uniref:VOC family protein n=1 Tax=Kitasatospora sp. NPDC048540 TaxID=3155634 RepID=UPI0033CFD0F6
MTAVEVRLAQGTPCWVSLMTTDLAGATEFYGALLGWEFEPGPDRLGAYVRAVLNGAKVAGLGVTPPGTAYPVEWTTYFAVDSADQVAQRIRECGGTVAVGPLTADRAGRLAIASDLSGAVFGIWEAAGHLGWEVVGEAGAPAWSELATADDEGAAGFYRAVLGRAVVAADPCAGPGAADDGVDGARLPVGGRPVAGIRHSTDAAGGPSRWRVHFTVADTDLTVHRALDLGGSLQIGPYDTPFGRVARLADPQGGRFSVVRPAGAGTGRP